MRMLLNSICLTFCHDNTVILDIQNNDKMFLYILILFPILITVTIVDINIIFIAWLWRHLWKIRKAQFNITTHDSPLYVWQSSSQICTFGTFLLNLSNLMKCIGGCFANARAFLNKTTTSQVPNSVRGRVISIETDLSSPITKRYII